MSSIAVSQAPPPPSQRLAWTIQAVEPTGGEVVIDRDTTVSSNLVVPASVSLRFVRGYRIRLANATLTIGGEIIAGPYRLFLLDQTSKVVRTPNGLTDEARPEWWVTRRDPNAEPDYTYAIQSAIDFFVGVDPNNPSQVPNPTHNGGTVLLRATEYRCRRAITLRDNVTLKGQGIVDYGRRGSVLRYVGTAPTAAFVRTLPPAQHGYFNIKIQDLSIEGDSTFDPFANPPFSAGSVLIGLQLRSCAAQLDNVYVTGFADAAIEIQHGINSTFERVRAAAATVCLRIDGTGPQDETTTQCFLASWFEAADRALVQLSGDSSSVWFGGASIFQGSNGYGVVLGERVDGLALPVGRTFNITFDGCHWENIRDTYLRAGAAAQVYSLAVRNPTFRPNNLTLQGQNYFVYDLDRVGWADVEVPFTENHVRTMLRTTGNTMRVIYRAPFQATGEFPPQSGVVCQDHDPALDITRVYRFGYRHTGPSWTPSGSDESRLWLRGVEHPAP